MSTDRETSPRAHVSRSAESLAKNTVILMGIRIGIPLLSVALMLFLSRILGAEGVGRYVLAFSFLYLFNAIGPLGLYPLITREGAKDHSALESILSNAFTLGTVASIICTALMAFAGQLLGYDEGAQTALVILSIAILPYTLGNFLEGACVAIEKTEFVAVGTLVEYVVKVGLGIAFLLAGFGLEAVLWLAVIGRALGAGVMARILRKHGVHPGWGFDKSILKHLLRLTPTFVMISVFATLYWRIDIFMLSKMQSMEDTGYYGASWRLLEFAMVVPTSLCLALYPRISTLVGKDLAALGQLGATAWRYLLALTLPLAIGTSLLSGDILVLVFGAPFETAATTLSILIWTLVPYSLVRYHAFVLLGANQQRIDLILNIVMSLVNVALNFVLIPIYSHLGAAIATFLAVCIYTAAQYAYMVPRLKNHSLRLTFQPIVLIASLVMAIVVFILRDVNFVLAVVAACAVYLGLVVAGGFFSEDELRLLGLNRYLDQWTRFARVRK